MCHKNWAVTPIFFCCAFLLRHIASLCGHSCRENTRPPVSTGVFYWHQRLSVGTEGPVRKLGSLFMMQSRFNRNKAAPSRMAPGRSRANTLERGVAAPSFASTAALNRVMPSIEAVALAQGCEVVGIDRLAGGMLRLTLDRLDATQVSIDDCEAVTRQLLRLFEVEQIGFSRLEVSSPGLDRALKRIADFSRYAGQPGKLKLRAPINGRKVYQGVWAEPQGETLGLVIEDDESQTQIMNFTLDEMESAQLIPQLDFGSKKR